MNDMIRHLCLLIFAFGVLGFTQSDLPDKPEFRNEPTLVNKDGNLKKLEQVHYESLDRVEGSNGTYGGNSIVDYVTFDTPKSPVRTIADAMFIVKITDVEVDPETLFFLTKVEGNRRERYVYPKMSDLYETGKLRVKIEFKKLRLVYTS